MSPTPFFNLLDNIDSAILEGPLAYDRIRELLTDPVLHAYFYDNLHKGSPDWARELSNQGAFHRAPAGQETDEGIAYPRWPELTYLDRLADSSADVAAECLRVIQPFTNPIALSQLLRAASKLETEATVRLHALLGACLRLTPGFGDGPALSGFVQRLATANNHGHALQFVRLALRLEPDQALVANGDDAYIMPRPRSTLTSWAYQTVLEENAALLATETPEPFLATLCDLLDEALAFSSRAPSVPDSASYIWRPDVATPAHPGSSAKDSLVTAVVDASRTVVEASEQGPNQLQRQLLTRFDPLFHRIFLYTLSNYREIPVDFVLRESQIPSNYEDPNIRREFTALLRTHFHRLAPKAQESVLFTIEHGPSEERMRQIRDRSDDASAGRYSKTWTRDWLSRLEDVLPPAHRPKLASLVEELGAFDASMEPGAFRGGFVGPYSPFEEATLAEMDAATLIDKLKSPPYKQEEFHEESPEGLARALRTAGRTAAPQWSEQASLFKDAQLEPTLVRGIIEGIEEGIKAGGALDWAGTLDFLEWVVKQQDVRVQQSACEAAWDNFEADPDFELARRAVASLLRTALSGRLSTVPTSEAPRIWEILQRLAADRNPTLMEEQADTLDAATRSINSVRGMALHAAVECGLWLHRSNEIAQGQLPEDLARLLERGLEPGIDQTTTTRAVIGWTLPYLVAMAPTWVTDYEELLFPDDQHLWRATWDTYVTMNAPYNNVFRALSRQYERAVRELPSHEPTSEGSVAERATTRLLEHLVFFQCRGVLEPDSAPAETLFGEAFNHASMETRARTIETLGRLLHQQEASKVPPDFLERARTIVDWRKQAGADSKELEGFGWWLDNDLFDAEWRVSHAKQLLDAGARIQPEHLVASAIERLSRASPQLAVELLDAIERTWSSTGTLWPYRLERVAPTTLGAVAELADPQLREAAYDLANRLGSHGLIRELRDTAARLRRGD